MYLREKIAISFVFFRVNNVCFYRLQSLEYVISISGNVVCGNVWELGSLKRYYHARNIPRFSIYFGTLGELMCTFGT